ncbi:MAG: class D beta-lactamase [Synechococcaceae cyanobacterium RL_1_2]|nr:class D beta-lactamase [Synechococcaceae cyanobacterium RL_1_2]
MALMSLGVGTLVLHPPWIQTAGAETNPPIAIPEKVNFGQHFSDLGVNGSIIIYDLNQTQEFEYNSDRNGRAFPVASTFKILNSLIALETKTIENDVAVLTWDGVPRSLTEWNRDLNLREAFRWSAVWFYQVLARKVGYESMNQWVRASNYGNQTIGTPEDIDRFWLDGTLQITPYQQIDFLRRLQGNQLPFSERSIAMVKDIMIIEKTPAYTLRAKTGWYGYGQTDIQNIGWYVGYLEQNQNVYFFATNLDLHETKDGAMRMELTRRCLRDLGLL